MKAQGVPCFILFKKSQSTSFKPKSKMAEWLSQPWLEKAINSFYSKNEALPKMAKAQIIKFNRAQTCEDRTAEAVISDKWMYAKALFTRESIENFERSMANQDQLSLMDIKGGLIFLNDYKIKPHVNYSMGTWEHLIVVKDFSFKGSQKSPQFGGDLINSAAYSPFHVKIKKHYKLKQIKKMLLPNQDNYDDNKCVDVKTVASDIVEKHQFVVVPQDQEILLSTIPGWNNDDYQVSLDAAMSTSMPSPQQSSSLCANGSETAISRNDIKELVAQCQQVPSFTDSLLECDQECSKESTPKSSENDALPNNSQSPNSNNKKTSHNNSISKKTSHNNHQIATPHEMQEYISDLNLLEQFEQQSLTMFKQRECIVVDIIDEIKDVAQRTVDQEMNDKAERSIDQEMNDKAQRTFDREINDKAQRTLDREMNDKAQRTLDQDNTTASNWNSSTIDDQKVETGVFKDGDCPLKAFSSQHVMDQTGDKQQSAGESLVTSKTKLSGLSASNSHSEGSSSTDRKSDDSYSILHDVSISELVPGEFIPVYTSTAKETSDTSDSRTDDVILKNPSVKRVSFSEILIMDEGLSQSSSKEDSDDSIVQCTQADDFVPRTIRDPLQLQGSVHPSIEDSMESYPLSSNRDNGKCKCSLQDTEVFSSLEVPPVIKHRKESFMQSEDCSRRTSVEISNSNVEDQENCIKESSSAVPAQKLNQNNNIYIQTTNNLKVNDIGRKPDTGEDIVCSCTFSPDKEIVMSSEESQEFSRSPVAMALDNIIRCIEVYEENPDDGKVLLMLDSSKLSPKNSKRSPISTATTSVIRSEEEQLKSTKEKTYNNEVPSCKSGKDPVLNSSLHSTSPVQSKLSSCTKEKNGTIISRDIRDETTLKNTQCPLNVQSTKISNTSGKFCPNFDEREGCPRKTEVGRLQMTKDNSSFDVSISDSLLVRQVFTPEGNTSINNRSSSSLHKSKYGRDGFANDSTNGANHPNQNKQNSTLRTDIAELCREELPSLPMTNASPLLKTTVRNTSMEHSVENERISRLRSEPMEFSSGDESPSLGVNVANVITNLDRNTTRSNSLLHKAISKSTATSAEKNVVVEDKEGKTMEDLNTSKRSALKEPTGSLRRDSKEKEDSNKILILPVSSQKRLRTYTLSGRSKEERSSDHFAVPEEEKENSPDDLHDSNEKSPAEKHCSIEVGQFYPKTSLWKRGRRENSLVNTSPEPNRASTCTSSSLEGDSSVMLNWLGLSRQGKQSGTKRKRSQEDSGSVKKANDGKVGWDMYSEQEPLILDESFSDEMTSQDINPDSLSTSPVLIPSPNSPPSDKQQVHHSSNSRNEESASPSGSLRESLKSCSGSRGSEEPCNLSISLTLPSYQVPKNVSIKSNNNQQTLTSKTSKQKSHLVICESDDDQDGFCWFTTKSWDGR